MSEEHVYTEQELSKMADALLEEADHVEIPAEPSRGKKKTAKKKDAAPEQSTKTPEERLNELLEKGKKAGKLTAKELECLEEINLDGEAVDKFYETLEKNGIDIDVGADDLLPPIDDVLPDVEDLAGIEEVTDEADLDVRETRATELWDLVSDEPLTREQQDKFRGFTWERENLDSNPSDDDQKRMNNLYRVRITVTWGARGQGRDKKEQESYVTLWRKP